MSHLHWHRGLQGYPFALLGMAVGAFAYFAIFDARLLDPTYYAWLMEGDGVWHFLGWHFFRYGDWSWPLGLITNLSGGAQGGSIVFTDSIPLLALCLKPFSGLLPQVFQYNGLWTLICYGLQGWFAWRIADLYLDRLWLRLAIVGVFCFSPILLVYSRQGLGAHWLVLAALYLYLKDDPRKHWRGWTIALVSAVLIHAYLVVMAFFLFLADLVQRRFFTRQLTTVGAGISLVAALTGMTGAALVAGYFVIGKNVAASGYGVWSLNALGLFLPYSPHPFDFLLPQHALADGQQEGFSYLGIGPLLLLPMVFFLMITGRIRGLEKKYLPLIAAVLILTVYALSNRITLGPYEILSYPLPSAVTRLANIFRASSRMVWPAYYLIYLALLVGIARHWKAGPVLPLLLSVLFIQAVETHHAGNSIQDRYFERVAKQWTQPLVSDFWAIAAGKYRDIVFVPERMNPHVAAVGVMAAPLGFRMNVFFFNRGDADKQEIRAAHLVADLARGRIDSKSLYVVLDERMYDFLGVNLGAGNLGLVDGLPVVAPNLHEIRTRAGPLRASPVDPRERFSYRVGERLRFDTQGNGSPHLAYGFSSPENWGVWSDGETAILVLCPDTPPAAPLVLDLQLFGFVPDVRPARPVRVLVNGKDLFSGFLGLGRTVVSYTARIPPVWIHNQCLVLTFLIPEPASPAGLGMSNDARRLGVGLKSLRLY